MALFCELVFPSQDVRGLFVFFTRVLTALDGVKSFIYYSSDQAGQEASEEQPQQQRKRRKIEAGEGHERNFIPYIHSRRPEDVSFCSNFTPRNIDMPFNELSISSA